MIHPYRPAAWLNSLRSPLHVRSCAVLLLFLSLILPGILSNPSPADAAAMLELYGSFNAMGIIATIGAADDVDQNATATVQYRTGAEAFHDGFPLSRVDSTHFVGSLFWLNPGTAGTTHRGTITGRCRAN